MEHQFSGYYWLPKNIKRKIKDPRLWAEHIVKNPVCPDATGRRYIRLTRAERIEVEKYMT